MRIVLDARKYFDYGIGTYIQNLVSTFGSRCDLILLISPNDVQRIDRLPMVEMKINSSGKYSLRELYSIAKDANRLKADIFHSPHYTAPFGLNMPCVTTIHDIHHIKGKKYFSLPKRMYARTIIGHTCQASAAIIVDSKFTKQELLSEYSIADEKIHVIHLGVSSIYFQKHSETEIQEFKNKYCIVKPTILYTGSLKPHKNVGTLIAAFSNLNQRSEFQLAFSGESIQKYSDLREMIKQKGISKDFVQLGQISRKELALAYKAASAVVLPSFYEGFGFSVLEAMASGTPAIGARAASIPEIMGEGGILFDPCSIDELTASLEIVMNDTRLRAELIKKGHRNAERFSWDKCTEQTFKIYQGVV
jgi:glycosyltransferase involved in cell wall biosynthesis